jgi:hypothetical protein
MLKHPLKLLNFNIKIRFFTVISKKTSKIASVFLQKYAIERVFRLFKDKKIKGFYFLLNLNINN